MTPALLQPEVAYPGTVKTEIGARRARAKQYYDRNVGGTPHDVIQPGQWVYANPSLSTSIPPGLTALLRKYPRRGRILWLSLMEKFAEIEQRSDWLQPHPLVERADR